MKLIFEDAFDHYLEDPDNEERIKKAEQDAIKLADKPLPKIKPPTRKHKWMIYSSKGNTPFYLNYVYKSKIYVHNKDDAPKMTESEMKRSLNKFDRLFGGHDGPYAIDD